MHMTKDMAGKNLITILIYLMNKRLNHYLCLIWTFSSMMIIENNIEYDSSLISNRILSIFDLYPFYNPISKQL